jgi:pimeloyl-ACP methyl ester carboxylesterase
MKICDIKTSKIAYEIYGNAESTIVIDTCLGSCSAEWWHIAKDLSKNFRVLVYDRAGYGLSKRSTLIRTPRNIALELNELLSTLNINDNILFLSHSQGSLYCIQYALMYPQKIKGLILLDPATPYDEIFKQDLSESEYQMSGIDKTQGYKIGLIFSKLKLGFLFKSIFKKSPPFYYYRYEKEAEKYILKSLIETDTYKTALEEYKYTHQENEIKHLREAINNKKLGNIPMTIITHCSKIYIEELQKYCKLDIKTATKIENKWQEIMLKYIGLSKNSKALIAPNSGHFIHLTDYNIVKKAIFEIL